MHDLVTFSHALADETRWRIVQLISDEALCVCELADILNMPQSSVSSHVQVIRKAGMLESERCEKWIYYRIAPGFQPLLGAIAKKFSSSAETNATLARDARRKAKRLLVREKSCCPGPRALAGAKPRRG